MKRTIIRCKAVFERKIVCDVAFEISLAMEHRFGV
jgi:hypothetical protein